MSIFNDVKHDAVMCSFQALSMKTPVFKGFAKHIKLDEQIELLNQDIRIAVGTPARIDKLMAGEHMKTDRLELVIIDSGKHTREYMQHRCRLHAHTSVCTC